MISVLHINAGSKIWGGVETFCLTLYRNIDRNRVQFDFLTPNVSTYESVREEFLSYGGNIYQFGINSSSLVGKIKLYRKLKSFFETHHYDIIHINAGVLLFNAVVAAACRKYTRSKIFVHSHSNGGRNFLKELFSLPLKNFLVRNADVLLACSKSSAEYIFPSKEAAQAHIINNGIDVGEFSWNAEIRQQIREKFGLQNKYVVGHVGRFLLPKNHRFLIEIFAKVKELRSDAVLILIGAGKEIDNIKDLVDKKNLTSSVFFLGQRSDVAAFYQAMDVFVLPSLFEGFGIVNIEAQASGLKCVVSDVVPEEVNVTGNVVRLPLKGSLDIWVNEILNVSGSRRDYSDVIRRAGFDALSSAKEVEALYLECV